MSEGIPARANFLDEGLGHDGLARSRRSEHGRMAGEHGRWQRHRCSIGAIGTEQHRGGDSSPIGPFTGTCTLGHGLGRWREDFTVPPSHPRYVASGPRNGSTSCGGGSIPSPPTQGPR